MRIPLYRRAVLGYCAHTWAIGAFSVLGPVVPQRALRDGAQGRRLHTFGVVTVIAGAIGTFLGGSLADRRRARASRSHPRAADHLHIANRAAANAQLCACARIGVANRRAAHWRSRS